MSATPNLETLSAPELTAMAARLEKERNVDALKSVLITIEKRDPTAAEVPLRLGTLLLTLDDLPAAEAAFARSAALPSNLKWMAFGGLGIALIKQGKSAEALPHLQKAEEHGITDASVLSALVQALVDFGRHAETVRITEKLARSGQAQHLLLHGRQLARAGRNQEAISVLANTLKVHGGNAPFAVLLANLLASSDRPEEAMQVAARILLGDFDRAGLHGLWRHCAGGDGPAESVAAAIGRRVTSGAEEAITRLNYSVALEKAGHFDAAKSEAERTLALRPDSLLAMSQAGKIELLCGDYDAAAQKFDRIWVLSALKAKRAEKSDSTPRPTPHEKAPAINRILYLPVEIGGRELHARLIIARYAAEMGFLVVLIGHVDFRPAVRFLPPGMIIYKSLNKVDRPLYLDADRAGHVITAIDEEAFGRMGDAALKNLDAVNLPLCHALFASGKDYAEQVLRQFPQAEGKVVETGNPRTDLASARLRPAGTGRTEPGRSILITTNFGLWNSRSQPYAAICETALTISGAPTASPRGQWLEALCRDGAAAECENAQAVREAAVALRAAFPDNPVIIRPHPAEDPCTWENLLKDQNITVEAEADLQEQMLAAGVVVHLAGCGTGLEAKLLDVPVICLNRVSHRRHPMSGLASHLSQTATDVDALAAKVSEALRTPDAFRGLTDLQRELLGRHLTISDEMASERVARHIGKIYRLHALQEQPSRPALVSAISAAVEKAKSKAEMEKMGNIQMAEWKKLRVTEERLQATLRNICQATGLADDIAAAQVREGVFAISCGAAE